MRFMFLMAILFFMFLWAISGRCGGFGCFGTTCMNSGNCGGDCVCLKTGADPQGVCVEVD